MRKDFAKILVERPRRGGGRGKNGRRDETELDPDLSLKRQSMKRAHLDTKSLNENLAPLRRFLYSKVGQLWDKVYSELHEHVSMGNAVQAHIFQHLWGYVEKDVVMVDGKPHRRAAWGPQRYPGGLVPLGEGYRGSELYIHPKTGILCLEKGRTKASRYLEQEAEQKAKFADPNQEFTRQINPDFCYKRENGIWYAVGITRTVERYRVQDWRRPVWDDEGKEYKYPYLILEERTVETYKRRQLSKKEIKNLGLNDYKRMAG